MLKFIFSMTLLLKCGWSESSLLLSGLMIFFFLGGFNTSEVSMFLMEVDFLSWNLVLLSFWLILLSVFSSIKIKFYNKMSVVYLGVMFSLFIFLMFTFISSNFLFFYLMFESCLIPIFLMILGWGYQPERIQAGIYMFFYTLFGSLPLFFMIIYISGATGVNYMHGVGNNVVLNSSLMFILLVGAFLVKFPMYGVHLWLLKAHVEAPVAGSMILAGILLKLGGYGLIRFSSFFVGITLINKELIVCVSLWGGLIMSIMCLRFMDMKLLIAASSVVHMSACISGIFILSEWGMKGCIIMMVAHGLCSSGLFCVANMVYERTNSRSMFVNKGLLNILPTFSLWWFILVVANMAGPPSYNLVGEIMLLVSMVNWSNFFIFVLSGLGFFSGAYSLYLYSLSQHGVFVKVKSGVMPGYLFEYLLLFLHWAPLNLFILSVMMYMYLD